MGLHKLRDLIAGLIYGDLRVIAEKGEGESTVVLQQTHFEPLASTIGGGSRITFGDGLIEPSKASSIYYWQLHILSSWINKVLIYE